MLTVVMEDGVPPIMRMEDYAPHVGMMIGGVNGCTGEIRQVEIVQGFYYVGVSWNEPELAPRGVLAGGGTHTLVSFMVVGPRASVPA